MKEKTTNASGDEARRFTVKYKQITDSDLKLKYVNEAIFAQISEEEIENSDVWALLIDETEEMRSLITVMKKNIWNDSCNESAKITHMHTFDTYLRQDAFMKFYLFIEQYYINNGIKSLSVSIPKVKCVSDMIKFFKRAGFKKLAEEYGYNVSNGIASKRNEPTTLLFKADLEKWYEKTEERYYPRIMKGEGVYKPVKSK